jgi:hypothetical protein
MQANNPKESNELTQLGNLFSINDMFEESIPYSKKAIEINDRNEFAHSDLIRSLIQLEQFD